MLPVIRLHSVSERWLEAQVFSIVLNALVMVVGTLFIYNEEITHEEEGDRHRRATTMAFTTFVFFQMFNALNCRSDCTHQQQHKTEMD
jgi:magnesium-transporting ATPase (P-type)